MAQIIDTVVAQHYLPAETAESRYYDPTDNGFGRVVASRMNASETTTHERG